MKNLPRDISFAVSSSMTSPAVHSFFSRSFINLSLKITLKLACACLQIIVTKFFQIIISLQNLNVNAKENRANIFNLQRVILYSYTVWLGRNRPSSYSINQLYLRHKLFVNFKIEKKKKRNSGRTKTSVTVFDLIEKK